MIKSMAFIAVFLGAVPFLLGLFYTRFIEEEKNNLLLQMASGYMILFGLFEFAALPLIWLRQPLSLLIQIYGGIVFALAATSLIWNFYRIAEIFKETFRAVKQFTFCIWAQFAVLLGQACIYVHYQYANADDSFYVAAATTALSTNTILEYSPYTGTLYEKLPSRYVLSPIYAFSAVVSKITDTHPAILTHTVFMILFLLLAYAVYALLGRALFSCDMEKTGYFLILLAALNIFAGYSERTSGLFLLIRLWQGKAVLAGILLPMILYLAIRIFMLEGKRADWVLLFFTLSACCMVSSMGVMLGAVMLGILGILFAFRQRNLRPVWYAVLCCLPNMICSAIYLAIR